MNDNIKIAIGGSLLINTVLIGYVIGYSYLFLFLSLLINGATILYIRELIEDSREMNEDMVELSISVRKFADHIEKVHSMEMFYGDAVLSALLDHSQYAMDDMDTYVSKYSAPIEEIEEPEGTIEFDGEEETEASEEE